MLLLSSGRSCGARGGEGTGRSGAEGGGCRRDEGSGGGGEGAGGGAPSAAPRLPPPHTQQTSEGAISTHRSTEQRVVLASK